MWLAAPQPVMEKVNAMTCGREGLTTELSPEELERCVRSANLLNDVVFKYLFATKGNEENLLRLLNDVLAPGPGIVSLQYLDRENDPRRDEGRTSCVDVLARAEDGRVCHVEVQLGREGYFFERALYYASCSYSDQLSVSDSYDKLRPVIFVSILNFCLFPDRAEDWRSLHRLLDVKEQRSYCDGMEFHFIEMPKLKRLTAAGRVEDVGLSRVMKYLGRIGGEVEMERLVKCDRGIERLEDGVRTFFRKRGNLALYRMRERAETDYRSNLKFAVQEAMTEGESRGRDLGRLEGRLESRVETARRMLDMSLSPSQISQATGLSLDEVEALKDNATGA